MAIDGKIDSQKDKIIKNSEIREILNSILSNPSYVKDEVIEKAIEDTEEIVKEKELEKPFILDIAIYRVFQRINLKLPENIEKAYNKAINRLQTIPLKNGICLIGKREKIWIF